MFRLLFFFFQAEDGIRDVAVTGVQTCALPISRRRRAGCRETSGGTRRRPSGAGRARAAAATASCRRAARGSEEHTSELQSRLHLVCRLLLEKKKSRRTEQAW